ncbi:MAG: amidohydrolase family protein [Actinomycetota bacterium]
MTVRIEADLLIPGRGEPIENGTVILEGTTIAYAGSTNGAPPTADADVVEVPVILPGLWDSHIHFVGLMSADIHDLVRWSVPELAVRAAADAAATLNGGVTGVREVGGFGIDFAGAINDGTTKGPHIYGAGSILSPTGGHADGHSYDLDFIESSAQWFGELCDGVPGCLKAVRKQLRKNAKVIKICASGGVMSEIDHPIHQQFSDEELKAIVEEARRAERFVAAHTHGLPGIKAAVRAGCQTIEHGSYLDEETAELMAEHGTIYVPTRFVVDHLLGLEDSLPRYAYEKGVMVADHHAQSMKIAVAAGVTIAMGTDIFFPGLYGMNSIEIRLLQDAGMTALEAIEAATANGPLTLGPQAPPSGQLREGYDADVIAIDFDPLEDNTGWGDPDRVTHIWKSGVREK